MDKTVVIITQNIASGGVQKNVSLLANFLADLGCHVHLVLFERRDSAYSLHTSITMEYLPHFALDKKALAKSDITYSLAQGKALYDFRVRALDEILRGYPDALLIAFEDYANLITLDSITSCSPRPHVIITVRSVIEYYAKAEFPHLLDEAFYESKIRALYPLAEKVVTVSEPISDSLRAKGVESEVIENGVDTDAIIQHHESFEPARDFILHVGRFSIASKGQPDLIEAFARIQHRIDGDLMLIGEGPDRPFIEERIHHFDLQARVRLPGFISEPYAYMKAARLFVFPSCYEGFPNALLEAYACQCPIISYQFETAWQRVTDNGRYACMVPRGDIDALADAMVTLWHDPKQRQKYAKASREGANAFDIQKTLSRWKQIIQPHLT